MAQTFADAFAAVEGEELDRAAGYVKPPPAKADALPLHPGWGAFGFPEVDRLVRILIHRDEAPDDYAREAVQDAFAALLETDAQRFADEEPEDLLGLVLSYASVRVKRMQKAKGDFHSLDHIIDMKMKPDGEEQERLDRASPVVAYTKTGVDEDARFTPPPPPGESWERHQAVGAVQRFRDEYGRAPRQREFNDRDDLPSYRTIRKLGFASLNELLLEAGVPIETPSPRPPWLPLESAEECYRFRKREGYWPSETDALRLPVGTLPSGKAMTRYFGGTSSQAVQEGCEAILGPIDRPQHQTSGELTRRLRRAWEEARNLGGGLTKPSLSPA